MWVAFGLITIALYFGHSMSFELRASDNREAAVEAEQAIEGGARYAKYVLATYATNGYVPDVLTYQREAVPVGDAMFWYIGRSEQQNTTTTTEPFYGLMDESSKLNLNTATVDMLLMLPRMTPELAAAIIDWRDTDTTATQNGAESDVYMRLQPPRTCKNAPFEMIDELRLVYGSDLDILYGEDQNLNGILDLSENDGATTGVNDNRDSRLDSGLLEYVTVYSRQPNNTKTNVSNQQVLTTFLQDKFGEERSGQILEALGIRSGGGGRGGGRGQGGGATTVSFTSVLDFYVKSKMTIDEFSQIGNDITVTNRATLDGLININTASAEVLACVPGIGVENAAAVVSYRQSNLSKLGTVAWLAEVLQPRNATQAGPYITAQSFQFTADIAAVGHFGRGYSRVRFVFDTSEGTPKIRLRQDLTSLGWALGTAVQQRILLAKDSR